MHVTVIRHTQQQLNQKTLIGKLVQRIQMWFDMQEDQ